MQAFIDFVNRFARALGFLFMGALVGYLIVATIDSVSRALARRREQRKQDRRFKDWYDR